MKIRIPLRGMLIGIGLVGVMAASPARGELKLHQLFSDNGILQRNAKVPVWGKTDKPEPVTVNFGEQLVTATPKEGKWKVELAAMEANATPRDLVVKQGDQTIRLKNILVGDVWICSGQSNMQWAVKQVDGHEEAKRTATNPNIRLFTVSPRHGFPGPQDELAGNAWLEASPESVPDFSAVGYYFGRELQRTFKIPVGLIFAAENGSMAERWIELQAIEADPQIKDMTAPQGKSDLYDKKIAPLAPFAIKGAIWYQGEGNARRPIHYRFVMAALVKNWRETFGQGDFPFLIVELAPFLLENDPDLEWAPVRESQQWVADNVPRVETVSIVDAGDEHDLHPPKKRPVGERLALAARALVYGEKRPSTGPRLKNVTFRGNEAVVEFKNVGGGLVAKDGAPTGFELAGADKKLHPAQARIEGETVVVTCADVPEPKALRFGWANYPRINLWNKDGFPAHPFRTDDWDVAYQNAK